MYLFSNISLRKSGLLRSCVRTHVCMCALGNETWSQLCVRICAAALWNSYKLTKHSTTLLILINNTSAKLCRQVHQLIFLQLPVKQSLWIWWRGRQWPRSPASACQEWSPWPRVSASTYLNKCCSLEASTATVKLLRAWWSSMWRGCVIICGAMLFVINTRLCSNTSWRVS